MSRNADDRTFQLHLARVFLAEASRRRHDKVSRFQYWHLFAWAQAARRRAATLPQAADQLELLL